MTDINKKFVAYYRVSTDKQGINGLGMESQKDLVESYVKKTGGEIIKAYIEVASGKKAINRQQLILALKDCKKYKATLVVAKLDRLARNVHFISGLQESKVKFVPADYPEINETFILMNAVFAQHEAKEISIRTKAALAKAKANGQILGGPKLGEINQGKKIKALEFAKKIYPLIELYRMQGFSYKKIAAIFIQNGIKTAHGFSTWSHEQITRVLKTQQRA